MSLQISISYEASSMGQVPLLYYSVKDSSSGCLAQVRESNFYIF